MVAIVEALRHDPDAFDAAVSREFGAFTGLNFSAVSLVVNEGGAIWVTLFVNEGASGGEASVAAGLALLVNASYSSRNQPWLTDTAAVMTSVTPPGQVVLGISLRGATLTEPSRAAPESPLCFIPDRCFLSGAVVVAGLLLVVAIAALIWALRRDEHRRAEPRELGMDEPLRDTGRTGHALQEAFTMVPFMKPDAGVDDLAYSPPPVRETAAAARAGGDVVADAVSGSAAARKTVADRRGSAAAASPFTASSTGAAAPLARQRSASGVLVLPAVAVGAPSAANPTPRIDAVEPAAAQASRASGAASRRPSAVSIVVPESASHAPETNTTTRNLFGVATTSQRAVPTLTSFASPVQQSRPPQPVSAAPPGPQLHHVAARRLSSAEAPGATASSSSSSSLTRGGFPSVWDDDATPDSPRQRSIYELSAASSGTGTNDPPPRLEQRRRASAAEPLSVAATPLAPVASRRSSQLANIADILRPVSPTAGSRRASWTGRTERGAEYEVFGGVHTRNESVETTGPLLVVPTSRRSSLVPVAAPPQALSYSSFRFPMDDA